MKKLHTSLFYWVTSLLLFGCDSGKDVLTEDDSEGDDSYYALSMGDSRGSSSGSGQGTSVEGQPGVVTAGEWNDLDNWDFWMNLFQTQDFEKMPEYWGYHTSQRISCHVTNLANRARINVELQLMHNGEPLWAAKTDNQGNAELWLGINEENNQISLESCTILIDNSMEFSPVALYTDRINEISYGGSHVDQSVQIAFVVDATGSMADELEFLKEDLQSVIEETEGQNSNLQYSTSAVFYRDIGDEYIVRHSDFSDDIQTTVSFIEEQNADGGGDYPEAVHTALRTTLNDLTWNVESKAKLAFVLLDAPPHHETQIISEIHELVRQFSAQGIKIIPISASGIDKETEFLLRFFAIASNGTYVFITDDSGVGNDHLEPSVGDYQVELLNELIPRLITKYSN